MFAIYDSAGGAYHKPFMEDTVLLGMRAFQTIMDDENSVINKYPDQFNMFYLGTFDMSTALFVTRVPLSIMNGLTGPSIDPEDPMFRNDLHASREEVLKIVNAEGESS